jgi:hypothetical protein
MKSIVLILAFIVPGCLEVPGWDADAHFAGEGYHCAQWASEALEAGWPVHEVPKLLRTIRRESMCLPHARSGTRDNGLAQINDIILRDMVQRPHLWGYALTRIGHVPTIDELKDPLVNLIVARNLYLIDGWAPWRGGA